MNLDVILAMMTIVKCTRILGIKMVIDCCHFFYTLINKLFGREQNKNSNKNLPVISF
jgi:hypothetical protein